MEDYLKAFIPYVLQKAFDFSIWSYDEVKKKLGNGVMIDSIIEGLDIREGSCPRIGKIVENAKEYMSSAEMS